MVRLLRGERLPSGSFVCKEIVPRLETEQVVKVKLIKRKVELKDFLKQRIVEVKSQE